MKIMEKIATLCHPPPPRPPPLQVKKGMGWSGGLTLYTFTKKKKFPGLPNLGAQIRCAQNWYTTVQMNRNTLVVAIFSN